MAKSGIVVNKLMLTIHGNDYIIANISPQQIPSEPSNYQTNWENGFTGSTNYYTIGRYGAEYIENPPWNHRFSTFMQVAGTGTFDLYDFLFQLSNGEYLHIWREEIGRNLALAIRRDNASQFTLYTYVYGTYTSTGAFPNSNIAQNEDYLPRQVKMSFGYDDVSERYVLYMFNMGSSFSGTPSYYSDIQCQMIAIGNATVAPILVALLSGNTPAPPTPSTDPYADGGYSTGTDTGTGTFDDTSESVPLPTTYALSATAAGIMSQYVLSEANLAAFGSWLWNGGTIIDDLKHFFQSPMEAIFSVGILPFTPSDTTQYNVYVGALAATGVQGGHVNDTVEKISCGSITFDGYYGGALDYNPYTKIELFLPYCGTLTLNPDEVMGHTISVDYYCDTITGDCVAFVSDEERVLHQVRGNCFIQIPLAARDFTALYSSAIAAIGTIAAGLATAASGGLSAPVAVGMGTSMAANAMNAKTHIARAGGVSGMAGFMSIQTPYVIMSIPNQCLPEFQNDFQGYPLFVTKRLGDFSGFTKVYEIHLDGLDCTDAEMKEIYELLKGGVVL